MTAADAVFLLDVDNTQLDNDRVQDVIRNLLECKFCAAGSDRYWAIFEVLHTGLGFADYLGALQRCRYGESGGADGREHGDRGDKRAASEPVEMTAYTKAPCGRIASALGLDTATSRASTMRASERTLNSPA